MFRKPHYLETWSDSRAFDGTVTIQQPLVEPLYNGKSAHEVLSILLGKPDLSSHDIVKDYWQSQNKARDFDSLWKTSLHDGWVAGTTVAPVNATGAIALRRSRRLKSAVLRWFSGPIRPSATGRYANNGWLQELPKPQSK